MTAIGNEGRRDSETDITALVAEGIRFVQIETPDISGTLRGKITRMDKLASPGGSAFCTILYGLSHFDDVVESRFSSFENGFPDATAVPDLSTLRILDRANGVASVICDMIDPDTGDHYALSPRGALRRAVGKAEALGYSARFAIELELCVIEADDACILSGGHHDQETSGRMHNAYSLARVGGEMREIVAGFMAEMDALGIPIEAMHAELGRGMMELAISHLPALEAADACARVKLYLKEYLDRHGLVAVFMPKWRINESGCGGHVHQSLWRDGAPAFADEDGKLTDIARQYVAGQLATLREMAAVFYPTVNAYRRMDAGTWAPENVSWGFDNRTCALRVITRPGPKACRIEHRCPGADVNPYLAVAAMLAGGLAGLEAGQDAPPPVEGNAAEAKGLDHLPRSLGEAIVLMERSESAGRLLGTELVEQYLAVRRSDWQLWQDWLREQVSPWELRQYFDSH